LSRKPSTVWHGQINQTPSAFQLPVFGGKDRRKKIDRVMCNNSTRKRWTLVTEISVTSCTQWHFGPGLQDGKNSIFEATGKGKKKIS
jgi:hypothetical protein